ncbi:MAG: molybdopterin-dependent oxidoreductase [Deltaproteobacteria bacterium]|nr:molybdopterin-dependent oxidoreductase [Deltaproteobacteria bacterium]
MPVSKLVGARVKRREDPRLVSGLAHYVDDIDLPQTLHVAILRTPYAHARIKSIDTGKALEHPGVVAVITGTEIRNRVGLVPVASENPSLRVPKRYVLAVEKVCFVGEGVTAVIAEDRYAARDALDLVQVEYELLPVVSAAEAALASDAPVIHSEFSDNVAFRWSLKQGDLSRAFQQAHKIVKQRLVHQRLAPIAIEPRGVLARYLPGERELTVWSSTQIPHILKTQLALMLKLPENRVRVIAPEVGGGFGSKLNVYAEEALVAYLAITLKRPVKWIEGRRENIQATIHGRGQIGEVAVAVKKDGTLLGLQYKVIADIGAYHQLLTPGIPPLTGLMLSGCYRIPAISVEVTGVFTNKMATDAYRGAGRPEATYVIERMVDRVAQEIGIDPVRIRQKNFPKPKEFPFKTATGVVYDSGNYASTLSKALKLAGYDHWREEQKRLRTQGRYLGIGISTYVEICGMGPSAAMPAGGWESGTVRIEPTGKVTVLTGTSPHGQGQETSFAQIVADELGVELDDITVLHGDTAVVPSGIGTFGSRATAVGGTAIFYATQKVKDKAREIAAHLVEADPDDLIFSDGEFRVKGVPKKGVTIQEVALEAHMAKRLPKKMEPGLSATSVFEPPDFTYPFGAHICVVEVDPQSGEVEIRKYVAVDDCGKVINPLLVDGQIQGGIVQGIGQALHEEVIYDENGQLLTGSLMHYAIPRAADVPRFELSRTETPTPVNPLGVKGVGEAGTIGSTPAVVNAVVDALAPFGVTHLDMPLKPEKIWQQCQTKSAS